MSDIKFEMINGQLCRMVEQPCPHCSQPEIIAIPVVYGSKEWALWQAENGKSFEHKTAHHCRIFTMFSETELKVTNEEGEVVEFVDIDRFLSEGAKDGWQLCEPESESPQPESPIDPIERPLRKLIIKAKENGKNIRTHYQNMIFTPDALTELLAEGRFRWWNICNWELTEKEQNYYLPIKLVKSEFKVGDWVEIEVAGMESQQLISKGVLPGSINAGGIEFYYDGSPVMQSINTKIIRKLDPSEVRVRITLEGQVTKPMDNAGGRFWLYYSTDEYLSVELDALSNKDRELVESLLKAQEEKK